MFLYFALNAQITSFALRGPNTGPEVLNFFSCSSQLTMKFVLLINLKLLTSANSFLLNIAEYEISLLINMKMPIFVGIFMFISRENFMLS